MSSLTAFVYIQLDTVDRGSTFQQGSNQIKEFFLLNCIWNERKGAGVVGPLKN